MPQKNTKVKGSRKVTKKETSKKASKKSSKNSSKKTSKKNYKKSSKKSSYKNITTSSEDMRNILDMPESKQIPTPQQYQGMPQQYQGMPQQYQGMPPQQQMISPSQVDPMMINHTVPVNDNKARQFLGMDTSNLLSADQMVNGLGNFSTGPSEMSMLSPTRMNSLGHGLNQMPTLSPTNELPMMGTPQPMMTTPQPMMGAQQPMMGTPQPMMGAQQPMMGAQQPMMATPQPMMGAQQPVANYEGLFNFTQ